MITSRATLITALEGYLNRADLTAKVPEFIQLAEAKIKRRVRRRTVRTNFGVASEGQALPATVLELRSIRLDTGTTYRDRPVHVGSVDRLAKVRTQYGPTGIPRAAAVIDGELWLAPAPRESMNLVITYYETFTPLANAADGATNDILDEAPDIYVYGALAEAEPYLENDSRMPLWKSLFSEAVEELNAQREREEFGGSPTAISLPVTFG